MSILNNQDPQQMSSADRAANQIVNQARSVFRQLVSAYNDGAKAFWNNPRATPQQVAAALGTDAAEVFGLHAKIGALLAEVKPEVIAPGQAVVGTFTVNSDGTVTVTGAANQPN
jgi:hypothetical protein